jgi:hypothetical protein
MFGMLLESDAPPVRRTAGAVASVIVHAALVSVAVLLGVDDSPIEHDVAPPIAVRDVRFVVPRPHSGGACSPSRRADEGGVARLTNRARGRRR